MAKQRRSKSKRVKYKQDSRQRAVTIYLSEMECGYLDHYVTKYGYKSRSAYIRSLVMKEVMGHLCDDYPTLFDQNLDDQLPQYDDPLAEEQ